jgi:hypothetical protein
MPWRRTEFPIAHWPDGTPSAMKAEGFKTILVYCVGPPEGDTRERCWHSSAVKFDDLPPDILAHLKCTKCGSVGWVDPRPNWNEVINYSKGVSG